MNGLAERTYAEWKAQNVTASAEYTAITVVAKRLSSTVAITQISTYSTEVSILAQPLTTQVSLQPNESQRNADGSEQLREAGVVAQSSFVKGAAHSKQRPGKISEMNVTLPVNPTPISWPLPLSSLVLVPIKATPP